MTVKTMLSSSCELRSYLANLVSQVIKFSSCKITFVRRYHGGVQMYRNEYGEIFGDLREI